MRLGYYWRQRWELLRVCWRWRHLSRSFCSWVFLTPCVILSADLSTLPFFFPAVDAPCPILVFGFVTRPLVVRRSYPGYGDRTAEGEQSLTCSLLIVQITQTVQYLDDEQYSDITNVAMQYTLHNDRHFTLSKRLT